MITWNGSVPKVRGSAMNAAAEILKRTMPEFVENYLDAEIEKAEGE
jgi:hypothetical protein